MSTWKSPPVCVGTLTASSSEPSGAQVMPHPAHVVEPAGIVSTVVRPPHTPCSVRLMTRYSQLVPPSLSKNASQSTPVDACTVTDTDRPVERIPWYPVDSVWRSRP
jgi:hypothetical protein